MRVVAMQLKSQRLFAVQAQLVPPFIATIAMVVLRTPTLSRLLVELPARTMQEGKYYSIFLSNEAKIVNV
jgi:hypothetical protein